MTETVAEFVARYPDDFNRTTRDSAPRWNSKTQADLRSALKPFATEYGHLTLTAINNQPADFFRPWVATQPAAYVQRVRTMLNDALGAGLVARNPLTGIRLEHTRGRRDITVLTEPELEELCTVAQRFGHTIAAMIATAAWACVRPGELFALREQDVNVEAGTLDVMLSYNGHSMKRPKNGRARAGIVLPSAAAVRIEAMRLACDDEPVACEHCWQHGRSCLVCQGTGEVDWLFRPRYRNRFDKASLYYLWHSIREAFGRPEMDFYELRHAGATLLLERGVEPEDVAWQMGHTDGGKLVRELYGEPHRAAAGRRARIRQAFEESASLEALEQAVRRSAR